jgi:flotillin
MKTVPPLNDLFNMAGLNLPTYLKGENDPPALPRKEDKPKDEKGGEKKSS